MRETTGGIRRKKVVSQLLAFTLASGAFAQPGPVFTLTDGNSSAQIAPNSQAGMFKWTVGGVNQLNQQWFWYALGNNAPASIDTISAAALSGVTANALTTTYGNATFNVGVTYTLTGGTGVGPMGGTEVSDIGESIKIVNTSAATLNFHFYEYSNFNLDGIPGGNSVTLSKLNGLFADAFQTNGGLALTETIVAPGANHGEAELFLGTLNELNNGVNPVTLSDNLTAGPGNVTWALEWDLSIGADDSALISKDKYLKIVLIPEPSVLALISLGVAALFVRKRCQRV
jgi:hypothetical protein